MWWSAPLEQKSGNVLARYPDAQVEVTRWDPRVYAPAFAVDVEELLREDGLL